MEYIIILILLFIIILIGYFIFNIKLKEIIHTETGIFGADMKVELLNDGPITIIIEK